jgi:hydrogenase nickel incorporation protein HypA/HybF
MHELGIAQSIINTVVKVAEQNGRERIEKVRIQVGEFRAVIQEQLVFSFGFAGEGTIAESAALEIEVIPIVAVCQSCKKEFRVKKFHFQCPACEGTSVRVIKGQELKIIDVELG